MWCGHCQVDVAAEVSPDNHRVLCTLCGSTLNTIAPPTTRLVAEKLGERTRDARELLQRWSSSKVVDPFGPSVPAISAISTIERASIQPSELADSASSKPLESTVESCPESKNSARLPISQSATPTPFEEPSTQNDKSGELRLPPVRNPLVEINDQSRPLVAPSSNPFAITGIPSPAMMSSTPTDPLASPPVRNQLRIDAAHPAVHFVSRSIAPSEPSPELAGPFASRGSTGEPQRSNHWLPNWDPDVWRSGPNVSGGWSSLAGQFLAYAGVLGLSAGACMVVWSYFGGPANYAPTGWLLATAGQMLLFFGVVSLVSGGLEQTTEQVNKRIEQLGDHIIRIEQAAREISLRGGPVPPAHFGHNPDAFLPTRSGESGDERSVVEQ